MLNFSSPSLASYHLEKLVKMDLVSKNNSGRYVAVEGVKVEVFSEFVRLMGMMVPRYFFYSMALTTMLLTYILIYPIKLTPEGIAAILFGIVGCLIMWIETIRAWIKRPF